MHICQRKQGVAFVSLELTVCCMFDNMLDVHTMCTLCFQLILFYCVSCGVFLRQS